MTTVREEGLVRNFRVYFLFHRTWAESELQVRILKRRAGIPQASLAGVERERGPGSSDLQLALVPALSSP